MTTSPGKKILVLSYEYPPLGGGGAKVVAGIAKEMTKCGYQFDIVTMWYRGLPFRECQNGITIYRVPCIRLNQSVCYFPEMIPYLIMALPIVLFLSLKNRYILNHTHFIFPDGILSTIIKFITKLPLVVTAHGSDVPGYNPDRFKALHRYLLPFWKFITNRIDTIICPSSVIADLITLSNNNASTLVIPNGIDITRFNPNRAKEDKALCVTRIFARKGVQYFLRAHHELKPAYEVNIVGNGPYLENLQNLVDQHRIKANLLGFIENKSSKLANLYETSSIFLFPSEAENFPICLLEAMVAGLAIVTTRNTGCEEVVGDCALLVTPKSVAEIKDAYRQLVEDKKLCQSLGRKARQRVVDQFSWDRVRRDTDKLYQKIGRHSRSDAPSS